MSRFDGYVICTSPRSGSTLLCRLLRDTGIAGAPDSHFHRPSVAAWLETYGLSPAGTERETLARVLQAATERGRGGTAVFGMRLQRDSFPFFIDRLGVLFPDAPTEAARVGAAFGRVLFVHLTRADKVAQAVSRVKAQQTGLWHRRADGSELERLAPPAPPVYDGAALRAAHDAALAQDRAWAEWFAAEGIAPLRVEYDALSEAPGRELARVLRALELDGAAAEGVVPGVQRLADGVNAEWVARLRGELGG